MKYLGLYIHVPFCEKKCDYCNFVSYCKKDSEKIEYVNALTKEIKLQCKFFHDRQIDSVFIGGGTPSCLPSEEIERIISFLRNNFNISKDAEITIEANPNSLTYEKLIEYKSAGINRLSIGLQAYNNKILKTIGRLHTKKQFNEAVKNAKKLGFENINVDLILGLPNQKLSDVKHELAHLIKLGVTHISAYGLIVEDGTKLKHNLDAGVYKLPSEEKSVKMYDFTVKYLQKHGIFRYEVSNFAKNGFQSKHNLKYWQNEEYLGLGAVSSSYVDGKRWKNTDDIKKYVSSINNGVVELEDEENLSNQSKMEERIMLSLRTSSGIDLQKFQNDFNIDLLNHKKSEIDLLLNDGFVSISNNHLFCTNNGFKLLNQIILQLID